MAFCNTRAAKDAPLRLETKVEFVNICTILDFVQRPYYTITAGKRSLVVKIDNRLRKS
jgi:hypothetical protein